MKNQSEGNPIYPDFATEASMLVLAQRKNILSF